MLVVQEYVGVENSVWNPKSLFSNLKRDRNLDALQVQIAKKVLK